MTYEEFIGGIKRKYSVMSPYFSSEFLEQAMQDECWWVRHACALSPHFKPEHVPILLNDTSHWVREAVLESPAYSQYITRLILE